MTDAKEYLRLYKRYACMIENKHIELSQFERDKRMILKLNKNADTSYVDKLMRETKKTIFKLFDEQKIIVQQIEKIENEKQKQLLILHYVRGMNFTEISKKLYYEYGTVLNLHNKAVESFAKIAFKDVLQGNE